MDVDYIQDSLAIHEGMPAGDTLRGFEAGRWRVEWHGEASTRWDGESSDMARLSRRGDGVSSDMAGLRRGWDGARAGQRGSLYFWHP